MRKVYSEHIEVAMRFVKLALLCLSLLGALTGELRAQQRIACEDISRSTIDQVRVPVFRGAPDSIVYAGVRVKNDSNIVGFRMLIQFDTTILTPVVDPNDATSIQSIITSPRFLKDSLAEDEFGQPYIDTITAFSAFFYQESGITHGDVMNCLFTYRFINDSPFVALDSITPGDDVIFKLKFRVKSTAQQWDTAAITFFEEEIYTDSAGVPILVGCNTTQEAQAWLYQDTTYSATVYPSYTNTFFIVDTTPQEATPNATMQAAQSSISSGQSTTLIWGAQDAKRVVITNMSTSAILKDTTITSASVSSFVSTGTLTSTTTFRMIATNTTLTDTATATVTVGGGGGGGAPVLGAPQTVYSLYAGETVSFSVTATDAEGGAITLSATASTMPLGASFPSATNLNSVSSLFSWVPSTSQVGTYQVQFRAVDPQGNTGLLTVTIVVQQLQFDRLFSTSVEGQRPVGGLPGKSGVFFPVNLISAKTVYGIQFDLNYPRTILTVDSVVPSGRIPEYVVYDNIGETPGDIRVVTFGLNNEPVLEQDTADSLNPTAVMFVVVTIDSNAASWANARMKMTGGRESINPNPNVGSVELVTDSGVVYVDRRGDVNLDQIIDVADPVSIVGNIIGGFNFSSRQFDASDVITDLSIDVFDLVGDVNLIYGIPISPAPQVPNPNEEATVSLAYTDMSVGGSDVLTVKSELPEQVAGVQLELRYDPAAVDLGVPVRTADNGNFMLQYRDDGEGKMKIVLYHMAPFKSGELMQVGTADLVNVPMTARTDIKAGDKSQLRLTQALMSTATAGEVLVAGVDAELPGTFMLSQNYPNPFNPTTTIQFYVAGNGQSQVNLDIYNILGQKVKSLIDGPMGAGEHEVEWDATANSGQRVATGVYLYRLAVGSESQTRKMLFLK